MTDPVLEVTNLTKDYGKFRAVDAVTFEVPRGKVVGLLGPNGAGKTTTIQMLVGITESTSGEIAYFGRSFGKNKQQSLQRINYTSAYNTLQGGISVRENLLVFSYLYNVGSPKKKIEELAEYFEISQLLDQIFRTLSAGQRTRVNLVKCLLNDPELILMDEPTASLDPDIRDKTLAAIEDLRKERQLSILFTSHNMDEVSRICDEVIFLSDGRIAKRDTPSNLIQQLHSTILILRFRGDETTVVDFLGSAGFEVESSGDHEVSVHTADHDIPRILSGLDGLADTEVTWIDIRRATMEDVFLDVARSK